MKRDTLDFKIFTLIVPFICLILEARPVEDKTVRWGYKVVYDPKLNSESIKSLRSTLNFKEVRILYPADQNWNIPSKFLSVSSHLEPDEIKGLSPLIQKVESAEKTHLLLLKLKLDLDAKEQKSLLSLFPKYKIQIRDKEEEGGSLKITVKTTLEKDQLLSIPSFGRLIESVE